MIRDVDLAAAAGLVLLGLSALAAVIAIGLGTYIAAKRVGRNEQYNDDVAEGLRSSSRRNRRP